MTGNPPLRLLLIEDNPGDARYIEELVGESTELSARVRSDGVGSAAEIESTASPMLHHETRLDDGLERLVGEDIDVVLLDLDLPDSKGLETLSETIERTEAPVVVLTGLSDQEAGVEALDRGAEEYLVKDEINSDLLVRSISHAIVRREHERELKRYEVLAQESTDVNAVLDTDGRIKYVTPSAESVLGYDPDEVVGEMALEYVHPDDREETVEALGEVIERSEIPPIEFRFRHADGSWVVLEARSRNLLHDPLIEGIVVYTRDVTERKRREQRLARQREQLAALNQLNRVVQEVTHSVIESATRDELERAVCEQLTASNGYQLAWFGELDATTDEITVSTSAGDDRYLESIDITADDTPTGQGPAGQAVKTGSIQVARDLQDDPDFEPWRERAAEFGFRSSAAIPITYDGTLYGVLNVYSERPYAFDEDERDVIGQLGEVVGHAITAIERKQALMSEEVVELELTVQGFFDVLDVGDVDGGRITFDRFVPLGDDRYAVYGSAVDGGFETLSAIKERTPTWEEITVISEHGEETHFEISLSEPPVISAIASRGGRIDRAVIEDGTYRLVVQLPPSGDVRAVVESVQEAYPNAELIAQRRTSRSQVPRPDVRQVFDDRLTLRQQSALEAAYFAGFFEWPRDSSGEDVAEMLDVSAPTFHQHLRIAEREILHAIFEAESVAERDDHDRRQSTE